MVKLSLKNDGGVWMSETTSKKSKINFEFPFFQCPNEIFDKDIKIYDYASDKERLMDSQEKLIFIYLFRCCNNKKSAFPSYGHIAERCCCSRRKAMYAIDNLYKNGYIQKKTRGYIPDNQGQVNKNHSNAYSLNYKKLQEF